MTDDRPQSSEEMLRRARESLTRPVESVAPAPGPDTPQPSHAATRPVAKPPRLRPPPRTSPATPAPARLAVALAVVIALIGAGMAILAFAVGSAP